MLAGCDRHRERAAAAGAVDVERGVADDRHAVEREVVAEGARPLARDGGQAAPVGVVPAVGGNPEERPQAGRRELDPGARLDIPGEKPDERVAPSAKPPDDLGHPGQHQYPRAVADETRELAGVGPEAVVELRPDPVGVDARAGHELVDDPQIGPAAEVVPVDRAGRSVGLLERPSEGGTAGATHGHQRAVDVEEEEAHPTGRPGVEAG